MGRHGIQDEKSEKTCKNRLGWKYVELHDAYISVVEALSHGGLANDTDVEIKWVNAIHLNRENLEEKLSDVDGILVPGGFGTRGIEGKDTCCKLCKD